MKLKTFKEFITEETLTEEVFKFDYSGYGKKQIPVTVYINPGLSDFKSIRKESTSSKEISYIAIPNPASDGLKFFAWVGETVLHWFVFHELKQANKLPSYANYDSRTCSFGVAEFDGQLNFLRDHFSSLEREIRLNSDVTLIDPSPDSPLHSMKEYFNKYLPDGFSSLDQLYLEIDSLIRKFSCISRYISDFDTKNPLITIKTFLDKNSQFLNKAS